MPTGAPVDPISSFIFQIVGGVLLSVVTSLLPLLFDSILTPLIEGLMAAFGITP